MQTPIQAFTEYQELEQAVADAGILGPSGQPKSEKAYTGTLPYDRAMKLVHDRNRAGDVLRVLLDGQTAYIAPDGRVLVRVFGERGDRVLLLRAVRLEDAE